METRQSLRALKHWRRFLPPWLLLRFSSCSLFIVSLGFSRKFAPQKLSILIIQFNTKLGHIILKNMWKYSPSPCTVSLIWGVFKSECYVRCHIVEEVDWEAETHDTVSCFKQIFNLQTCWKQLNIPLCTGKIYLTLVSRKNQTQPENKGFGYFLGLWAVFLKAVQCSALSESIGF